VAEDINNGKGRQYQRNKPRQNRTLQEQGPSHEFNTYNSRIVYSNYTLGLSVFDLYSKDDLKEIVQDPMAHNKLLRELSLIIYGMNGTYTNTVDYMTAMPTLDRVIVPHGKSKAKKQKNAEIMDATLRTIRDREFVRDALWRGMIEGIAFYYFETTEGKKSQQRFMDDYEVGCISEINELGINASIFSLPTDYTEIIGRRNNSYVIAFNLDYFTTGTGETPEKLVRKFPKEIREAYEQRKTKIKTKKGNWVVLDSNKTIVHKIRSSRTEKYGRPLVLAAIRDILYDDYFTDTKRNVLDEINNKLIYETFPEGQQKGTCALTKQQQEAQHNAVKGAIQNKNNVGGTSFVSVSAGTKIDALKVANTDIFDEKYESDLSDKISKDLGFAGSLLNGVGSGSYSAQENNLELITAEIMQWIDQIQTELNKCISWAIIKDKHNWVECKYLPITHVNKSKMVGYAQDLYLQGKGSLSLWAAACGLSPDVFFAMLDQELEQDVENKYPAHQTSYTLTKKAGRPETDEPTDRTVQSRSNNGNALASPSDE